MLADLKSQIQVAALVTEKLEKDVQGKAGYSRVRSGIRREFSEFKEVLEKSKARLEELQKMQKDLEGLERDSVNSVRGSRSSLPDERQDKEEIGRDAEQEEFRLTPIRNRVEDNKALSALRDYEQMSNEETSPVNQTGRWDEDEGSKGQSENKSKKSFSVFHFDRALNHRLGKPTEEEKRDDDCHTQNYLLIPEPEATAGQSSSLADRERTFRTNLQLRAHEFATKERSAREQKSIQSARSVQSTRSNVSAKSNRFETASLGNIEISKRRVPLKGREQKGIIDIPKIAASRSTLIASPMSIKTEHTEMPIDTVKSTSSSHVERETLSDFASRLERSIRLLSAAGAAEELEPPHVEDKHIISAMESVVSQPQGNVRLRRERTEPALPSGSLLQNKRSKSLVKVLSSSSKGSKLGRTLSSGLSKSIRLMTGKKAESKKHKHQTNLPDSMPALRAEDRRMEECLERQELKAREAYIKAMQEHQALVRSGTVKEASREYTFSQKKLQAFFAKIEYWENMKTDFQTNPDAFAPTARSTIIEALSVDNDEIERSHENEEIKEMNEDKAREAYVKAVQHHQSLIRAGEKPGSHKWLESEKWQQNCLASLQHWENKREQVEDTDPETKERKARDAYIRAMKYHQKLVNSKVEPGSRAWIESERNQRECLAKLQYWETLNMGKAGSNYDDRDEDTTGFGFEGAEMKTIYFDTPKTVEKKEAPTKTLLDAFTKIMPDLFGNFVEADTKKAKEKAALKNGNKGNDSDNYDCLATEKGRPTIYSYLVPQCSRVGLCCGSNEPCSLPDSLSDDYEDSRVLNEIVKPKKQMEDITDSKMEVEPVKESKARHTQLPGHPQLPVCIEKASEIPTNPPINSIENEAREILGHLSNDYESTRLDESFTLPSGLTPKGKDGVFWQRASDDHSVAQPTGLTPTSNGGMLFWTGDAGGPRDFSAGADPHHSRRPSDLPSFRRKPAKMDEVEEEPDDDGDGDENSAVSYVLGQDDHTFFCGLERF